MSLVLQPVERSSIGRARRFAVDIAASVLPVDRLDDVALVVSELVTNALEHGTGPVEVRGHTRRGEVTLVVGSASGSLPVPPPDLPPVDHLRGRGLHIVAALADGVVIRGTDGRVEVEVRFTAPSS